MDSEDIDDMAVGDWVLVTFLGKKTIEHFLGEIIDFDTDVPIIKFMRKQSNFDGAITSKYPPREDVSSTEKTIDFSSYNIVIAYSKVLRKIILLLC
ncbi:hypothetical protein JTB14_027987 [Gonioctena quinquepunctata]|nr:hypothetical protein JTB14_027987 [Gonioctena quinquepunctata]